MLKFLAHLTFVALLIVALRTGSAEADKDLEPLVATAARAERFVCQGEIALYISGPRYDWRTVRNNLKAAWM